MPKSKELKTYSLKNIRKKNSDDLNNKTKSLSLPSKRTTSINKLTKQIENFLNINEGSSRRTSSNISTASTIRKDEEIKPNNIDFSRMNLNEKKTSLKYNSLPKDFESEKIKKINLKSYSLPKELPSYKLKKSKPIKKINNYINVNNYNFKPSYISAIKTGSDLSYLYIFDIFKEEIIENINDNEKKSKDEYYMDGLLKCCFMFLNKIQNNENEKYLYNQIGGSCKYIPINSYQNSFLKFQYIFDNKHDFNIYSNEIPESWLYKEDKIMDNELKPLFKLEEKILFNELLKKSNQIIDNILYFSVYNLIEYKKNNPNITGRVIINNEKQLKLIEENTKKFIKDILLTDTLKFISDGNMNVGKSEGIQDYCSKLSKSGIIKNSQIQQIISKTTIWKSIKNNIKEFVKENRLYTYEDIFDSYPIKIDNVITEINKLDSNEIKKYAYITDLIFNNKNFNTDTNVSLLGDYLESFKAYTLNLRKMFSNVYYYDTITKQYETAIIFNNSSAIEKTIPVIISDLIYLKLDLSYDKYIYISETNKKADNYYAVNLTTLRNSYEGTESLNTRRNIINIIKILDNKNNINEIINLFKKRGADELGSRGYNLLFLIYISKFIELEENIQHNNISNFKIETKIKIAHCLFDLKRAGDMGKILFTYFYNCLKNTPLYATPTDLCYIGNDKLALLNSIIRQGNSVIYPDASNYAFSIYNINNKNFTFLTLMGLINMYLIPKFINNNYDVFNDIDVKVTPELYNHFKTINYIFRNIDHNKIYFKQDGVIIQNQNEILNKMYETIIQEFKKDKILDDFENLYKLRENIQEICGLYIERNKPSDDSSLKQLNDFLIPVNKLEPITQPQENTIENYINKLAINYKTFNETHSIIINDLIKQRNDLMIVDGRLNIAQSDIINALESKINYLTLIRQFTMIYNIREIYKKPNTISNVNNYIKTIIFSYLEHIKKNLKKNVIKEEVIEYYLTNIIFYRINFDFYSENSKIIKSLFKLFVKKFLLKISNLIEIVIEKIKSIIISSSIDLLSDTELIRNLLININKFLKIIEVFIYVDINEQNEITNNENNIHDCIEKLKYYIYDLLTLKSITTTSLELSSPQRFKLTYQRLQSDKTNTLLQQVITPIQQTNFDNVNIGVKCKILTNSLFNNIENLNNVIIFNLLYKELNKYNKIEILGQNLLSVCPELLLLIQQIKKIYNYAYIEIHEELNKSDKFNIFIEDIISLIKEKTETTISSFNRNINSSGTRERKSAIIIPESKKIFFEKITQKLIYDIEFNIKPNFIAMENFINDDKNAFPYTIKDLTEIRYFESSVYYSELIENKEQLSDIRTIISTYDISSEDLRNYILPLLNEDGLNKINIEKLEKLEKQSNAQIKKIGKVYNFFINDLS